MVVVLGQDDGGVKLIHGGREADCDNGMVRWMMFVCCQGGRSLVAVTMANVVVR